MESLRDHGEGSRHVDHAVRAFLDQELVLLAVGDRQQADRAASADSLVELQSDLQRRKPCRTKRT